jgi:hypothetical protein
MARSFASDDMYAYARDRRARQFARTSHRVPLNTRVSSGMLAATQRVYDGNGDDQYFSRRQRYANGGIY